MLSTVRGFLQLRMYLLLFIPLIIIGYPLMKPGTVIGDGDFPYLQNALYPAKMLSTWIDFGSYSGFEVISRYPIIFLGLALNLIGVTPDIISKLMIISVFLLASATFYFSFLFFFKKERESHLSAFRVAAIVGSLFYAYNVWSFDRIAHWYFWIGYALFPLFFVSIVFAFKEPREWKYIFIAVLSWTVASSTPHMVVFYGLVFAGVSIFFVIRCIVDRYALARTARQTALVFSFYVLLNSFWMYPFVMSLRSGGEPVVFYALVTEEMTQTFSVDNTFLNVLRIIQDWDNVVAQQDVKIPHHTSSVYPVWLFASFVFPLLAFSALLFRAFLKYSLVFSLLATLGILLTMGTNAPFNLYSILLFEAPLFSNFQLLFRDPDKWAFLIPFSYSFLLGITTVNVLRLVKKAKIKIGNVVRISFLFLLVSAIAIYPYQIYRHSFGEIYEPVTIPKDFDYLESYLAKSDTDKVLFIPFYSEDTNWSNNRELVEIYSLSSTKPSIGSYYLSPHYYYRYLKNAVMENKTDNIQDLIIPFGSSFVIFHNDSGTNAEANSKLLKKLFMLDGIENINNAGFFVIFKADKQINQVSIPTQAIVASNGLEKIATISSMNITDGSHQYPSVLFLDNSKKEGQIYNETITPTFGDDYYLLLLEDSNDLFMSLLDDKYLFGPFDATNHYKPSKLWSKAGSMDPWHGEFHPFLESLQIDNWNFDYGRGLVFTKSIGTNLSIPIDIEINNEDGEDIDLTGDNSNNSAITATYDIYMRYLKNEKGGVLKLYMDNEFLAEVDTRDKGKANDFVWENIKSKVHLREGKHMLTLENDAGFNAVNLFAILPTEKAENIKNDISKYLVNKTRSVILLEAESDFYVDKAKTVVSSKNNTNNNNFIGNTELKLGLGQEPSKNFNRLPINVDKNNVTYSGQFATPKNSDLMSLYFLAKKNSATPSTYTVKNLEIFPDSNGLTVFNSDFENGSRPIELTKQTWEVVDGNASSIDILAGSNSTATSKNNSVYVFVEKGNSTNWSILSTDFIPVNADGAVSYYNYSMDISAKDVSQLHSKVHYFDSSKKEIGWDFLSEGRDGTFTEDYHVTIGNMPQNTKFAKLQLWVSPNVTIDSSYYINKASIQAVSREQAWIHNHEDIISASLDSENPLSGNGSMRVKVDRGYNDNSRDSISYPWSILSTDFIPVNADGAVSYYNYSMDISAKDVSQLHSKVHYFDSSKKEIGWDFLSEGRDGTFTEEYSGGVNAPLGTRYLKLEIFVKPTLGVYSEFFVDNVTLDEVHHMGTLTQHQHNFYTFENLNPQYQELLTSVDDQSTFFKTFIKKGNISSGPVVVHTKPFTVQENSRYNYTISVDTDNLSSLNILPSFLNSSDIVKESTKYRGQATNGRVLSLSPGSEVYANIDIAKPSNYSIALRSHTCQSCTSLKVSIEDQNDNEIKGNPKGPNIAYANRTDNDSLKWFYLHNTTYYLDAGKYEVKIYSDSQADLDSVIIYSPDKVAYNGREKEVNQYESVEDIFYKKNYSAEAAKIEDYRRISSTKHIVKVSNATQPFILSFAESFDPLWSAYIDSYQSNNSGLKTNSFPLYSMINGFYISAKGDYALTIEYQPQVWFDQGASVSVLTIVGAIGLFIVGQNRRRNHRRKEKHAVK